MRTFNKFSVIGITILMVTSIGAARADEGDVTQTRTQDRTRTEFNLQTPTSDFGQSQNREENMVFNKNENAYQNKHQYQYKHMNQYQGANSDGSATGNSGASGNSWQGNNSSSASNRMNDTNRNLIDDNVEIEMEEMRSEQKEQERVHEAKEAEKERKHEAVESKKDRVSKEKIAKKKSVVQK